MLSFYHVSKQFYALTKTNKICNKLTFIDRNGQTKKLFTRLTSISEVVQSEFGVKRIVDNEKKNWFLHRVAFVKY